MGEVLSLPSPLRTLTMSPTRCVRWLIPLALLAWMASGCTPASSDAGLPPATPPGATGPAKPEESSPVFRAQELPFRYERGLSGVALPPETTGGGVGMLDFDGDGDLDLFFAQGVPLNARGAGAGGNPPADSLLRNDSGKFVDISGEAGLTSRGYGQGVCVGDYDGDGDPDVYVTRYGVNTLWRNDKGKFTDVTAESGVGCPLWSLGSAFFDADGDGDLDLFVANYFDFDPARAPFERDEQGKPRYGLPEGWAGQPDVLYRNNGDGTFTDATASSGIRDKGRGMGCLAADFDDDGRMDLLVANDAEANNLWRNKGDGTFEDVAPAWGIAFNGQGKHEANMGIARGDTDDDGLQDVVITHYVNEHDTLWRPLPSASGGVVFDDQTQVSGLGGDSRPMTGWGIAMADLDQDGRLDFAVTNGHIRTYPEGLYPLKNPPLLWKGLKAGRFRNVSAKAGAYFSGRYEGRGMACGDLDGDGDLDLVVVPLDGPAVVLWNETPHAGGSVILTLVGKSPNTDAIGATVTATIDGRKQVRAIDGGGSYIGSHAKGIHFGLGGAKAIDSVEVRWPSGQKETRTDLPAGSRVRWVEGSP